MQDSNLNVILRVTINQEVDVPRLLGSTHLITEITDIHLVEYQHMYHWYSMNSNHLKPSFWHMILIHLFCNIKLSSISFYTFYTDILWLMALLSLYSTLWNYAFLPFTWYQQTTTCFTSSTPNRATVKTISLFYLWKDINVSVLFHYNFSIAIVWFFLNI